MASVTHDLHGQQPSRPPLSLSDEPLSPADAASVRSAEAKAAVVVQEWLAFSADSQITDAAVAKAFRAILRILMSYGDEASLSDRPYALFWCSGHISSLLAQIPPIVTIIQDSTNAIAPKEALCNSLILYIGAHFLQSPFLHPYVEAEILSSLLAAYASPWTENSTLRMDLRDFFAEYASHSPLHQLELAELVCRPSKSSSPTWPG
ncbi:hypothetical protein K525DRAFT_264789 [Schizophyllum commune Loenen D]|nr:hypothetical protein K525DRAFT_264789 [Schizophyllum commune Loenen D]